MSHDETVRGPDFLPYPLPDSGTDFLEPIVLPPVPGPTAKSRLEVALDALPFSGIVALTSGLLALVSLSVITWAADRHDVGAVLCTAFALVAVLASRLALTPETPKDSRTLVRTSVTTGVVSAIVALSVLAFAGSGSAPSQSAVPGTSPLPTSSPTAAAKSAPGQPAPTPTFEAPPGATSGFGVPSQPGPPLSQPPTDTGTLYGNVVTTSGQLLEGATVTVTRSQEGDTSETPECPLRITTQTDPRGVYRLQVCQLSEGLGYQVALSYRGVTTQTDVFINSGRTTVYDVILPVRGG